MKKIILLAILTSFLFGQEHKTIIKRNTSKNQNARISFKGNITDITNFSKNIRVKIKTEKHNNITVRIKYDKKFNFFEKDKIRGICTEVRFNDYHNCRIYRSY